MDRGIEGAWMALSQAAFGMIFGLFFSGVTKWGFSRLMARVLRKMACVLLNAGQKKGKAA